MSHAALLLPALLLFLPGPPACGQAAGSAPAVHASARVEAEQAPFLRLTDSGPGGFTSAPFDAEIAARFAGWHDSLRPVPLLDLPLPGGESVDLMLRPVRVWEPGGSAIIVTEQGREERLAPSIHLFAAHAPGRQSSGFLGVSSGMLHGYLQLDGVNYLLSTGADDGTPKPLAISHGDLFAGGFQDFCRTTLGIDAPPATTQPRASTTDIHRTPIVLEIDQPLRNRFSSDQNAVDYATLLLGACSEIFRRDLGIELVLPSGNVRVWNQVTPWGAITGFGWLGNLRNWWQSGANSMRNNERAQVHVLHYSAFGGEAYVDAICDLSRGYAISGITGSFPYPLDHSNQDNWDLFVVSHESGHVYGSGHSFDYSPSIECDDGSGPDYGTIMSYCHTNWSLAYVGLRFHERVQDVIRARVATADCVDVVPIALGDYDANGLIDALDIAAYDAYVEQGFASRGCQETFDLSQDGTVTPYDRQLLTQRALPPASSTPFNGTGANCGSCYGALTQPVLGTTWSTFVQHPGARVLTTILAKRTLLTTPIDTRYGEVLIAGPNVFLSHAVTNGQWAEHHHALPVQLSMAGTIVQTQAVVYSPAGPVLQGGLTIQVSTY